MNLNEGEKKVLAELAGHYSTYEGFVYSCFNTLASDSGLDRKAVRRACRSLSRKGLAQFGRGLWTEDGEPAGSGYAATKAGSELAAELPRRCVECDGNIAEPPTWVCPGCEAYRDHQR